MPLGCGSALPVRRNIHEGKKGQGTTAVEVAMSLLRTLKSNQNTV